MSLSNKFIKVLSNFKSLFPLTLKVFSYNILCKLLPHMLVVLQAALKWPMQFKWFLDILSPGTNSHTTHMAQKCTCALRRHWQPFTIKFIETKKSYLYRKFIPSLLFYIIWGVYFQNALYPFQIFSDMSITVKILR